VSSLHLFWLLILSARCHGSCNYDVRVPNWTDVFEPPFLGSAWCKCGLFLPQSVQLRCTSGAVTRGYTSHFPHELVSGFQVDSYVT